MDDRFILHKEQKENERVVAETEAGAVEVVILGDDSSDNNKIEVEQAFENSLIRRSHLFLRMTHETTATMEKTLARERNSSDVHICL